MFCTGRKPKHDNGLKVDDSHVIERPLMKDHISLVHYTSFPKETAHPTGLHVQKAYTSLVTSSMQILLLSAHACIKFNLHFPLHDILKADRPHPRNYPHAPTNYIHTDKHLRLVMTLIALCCRERSDGRTDGQTDGRYQVHYLPRFAVDNYCSLFQMGVLFEGVFWQEDDIIALLDIMTWLVQVVHVWCWGISISTQPFISDSFNDMVMFAPTECSRTGRRVLNDVRWWKLAY